MIQRCENPNHKHYEKYARRGIKVCERWHDFAAFLADMGERPSVKHSIERKDNDGNYELSNCVWATQADQMRNQERTHVIEYDGRLQCLTDWAIEKGLNPVTLSSRLRKGWSIDRALTEPTNTRFRNIAEKYERDATLVTTE